MTKQRPLNIASFSYQPGVLRAFFGICCLLIVGSALSSGIEVAVTKEHGGLELASFVCLSLAAIVSLSLQRAHVIKLWAVSAILTLLALREVDFHNWWFEDGLLQIGVFSSSIPLWQKFIPAALMVFIAVSFVVLMWRGTTVLLAALKQGEMWGKLMLCCAFCVVGSLSLDGLPRKLRARGFDLTPLEAQIPVLIEEVFEFGFAFALLAAVVLFARSQANRRALSGAQPQSTEQQAI